MREPSTEWREWRREIGRLGAKSRKTRMVCATPPWVDADQLEAVYIEAWRMRQISGLDYEVDHFIPIAGQDVCGLHVPWNLQIILKRQNLAKGNSMPLVADAPAAWIPRPISEPRCWCPVTGDWRDQAIEQRLLLTFEEAKDRDAKMAAELIVLNMAAKLLRKGVPEDLFPPDVFDYVPKEIIQRVARDMRSLNIS